MRRYLPLIQKNYVFPSYGQSVSVKEGLLFLSDKVEDDFYIYFRLASFAV